MKKGTKEGDGPLSQDKFSQDDFRQFEELGKSVHEVQSELETLRSGTPAIRLNRPCELGDGVLEFPRDGEFLAAEFDEAAGAGRVTKFVPASGAASRMFQIEKQWIGSISSAGDAGEIVRLLLGEAQLEYQGLPKGLIPFHAYPNGPRTAFEEHLADGAWYARDRQGLVRVHFTVPEHHRDRIATHLEEAVDRHAVPGVSFEVSLSVQDPATNTVACDSEFRPVRDEAGSLLFRPAGHGALLANLQSLQADIVFLRNIDNVVHERLHDVHSRIRKVLGGYLVRIQNEIFSVLDQLARGQIMGSDLDRVEERIAKRLPVRVEPFGSREERISALYLNLNRPLRVCGVVRLEQDSGGGPFWVEDADGEVSLQMVETSQVDLTCSKQRQIWESSTFFNPVEMVCGLRSFDGRQFELSEYRDPSTCFVAEKSWNGQPIKMLELPGLWNGSMAFWNTVFIEVPKEVFNPVKTVLDLREPAHQR